MKIRPFLLVACLSVVAVSSWAQDCAGPQRIVVGFSPGGGADALARVLAERLGARTGRTVIVENRTGAAGNLASSHVAKSPPDGCTLMLTGSHHNLNPLIFSHAGYQPSDFSPVINVIEQPAVLVTNPSQPLQSVAQIVEYAKANPGKLSYSSSGLASPNHIAMELFLKAAKIDIVHIPYKGAGPALNDTIGGVVALSVGSAAAVQPHIASGRLKAVAQSLPKRSPLLPDVPTFAEAGYPAGGASNWVGILAPAATPLGIRQKINNDIRGVVQEPEVRSRFATMGFTPVGSTIDEFDSFLKDDERVSRKLTQELKLKVD